MKEATGELNMTVITVVAIAAIAALFYTLVWPAIQRSIVNNTCATLGNGWEAVNQNDTDGFTISATNAADVTWFCCNTSTNECINPNN